MYEKSDTQSIELIFKCNIFVLKTIFIVNRFLRLQ